MRIHVLQHVAFEGPAGIAEWVSRRGHALQTTRLYAGDPLPGLREFDVLVVMGGPMGVHDEAQYAWMADEKRLIREAVEGGKAVLGVCLGAQLIADVLGAAVTRNAHREIGWFEIHRHAKADQLEAEWQLPAAMDVFHWHGDTFAIPADAVPLYRSSACENQAFLYRDRVLALQFHLETTAESARLLVENGRADLDSGPYVQSDAEILRPDVPYAANQKLLSQLLDRLCVVVHPV